MKFGKMFYGNYVKGGAQLKTVFVFKGFHGLTLKCMFDDNFIAVSSGTQKVKHYEQILSNK